MRRKAPAALVILFCLGSAPGCIRYQPEPGPARDTGKSGEAPGSASVDDEGKEAGPRDRTAGKAPSDKAEERVVLSESEWKKRLTPEQYRVLRQKGTERAFTGKFWDSKKEGTYLCAACGNELFSSGTKFDSGTGWPSFWAPASEGKVMLEDDSGLFMTRTEVLCKRCESHLGHVFDDGPPPTNLRYCINSAALDLREGK